MAYRKQKQQILAGSLNLLPPGDKIPDGDSLALLNWRVGQEGQLRSRVPAKVLTSALSGGTVHSIFVQEPHHFAGVGAQLYAGETFETSLASGFDGKPLGVVSYQGQVWIMNRGKQCRTPNRWTAPSAWTLAAPSSAPTAAAAAGSGALTGTYTYYVTYGNQYGHESNPSAASNTITLSARNATITLPVSSDSQVRTRYIYRAGGGLDTPLRVGMVANNYTTSFTDSLTDSAAQDIGTELEVDHDPAPACSGLVGPYFGKLIAFSSTAHSNRMWWTRTAQPWYFPGSDDDSEGNWNDVGADGEAIVAVTVHKQMIVIYKERSIWRLVGDPDENDPVQTNANIGIFGGMRAVTTLGTMDYFRGAEGIYSFNGDSETLLTRIINPTFQDEWTEIGPGLFSRPLNRTWQQTTVMGASGGRIYVSAPEWTSMAPDQGVGPTAPNTVLVYDTATGRWSQESFASSLGGTAPSALFYDGTAGIFYAGIGSKIYNLENTWSYSDEGAALALVWQSRYLDQGLPDNPKVYADLVIDYRTATAEIAQTPATLTVKLLFDNGATSQTLGTISSATRTRAVFPLGTNGEGIRAANFAVRIEGTASARVVIENVYIHYYVEARAGRSFDTGVIDLGNWRDKQVDALEIETVAPSAITPRLYTDLPSGALALRWANAFPAASSHSVLRQTFPLSDFRKLRLTATSPAAFQLWGVRLRVRPIAAFIDGTQGEVFETRPFGLGGAGFEYVEEFRELEFDLETAPLATGGLVVGEIWTDLPGDALAKRHQFTIYTDPTHQRPFNVRLPGHVKGRQYKLRLTPASTGWARLYGVRAFSRTLGTAEAQAWAWKPLPLLETPPIFEWVDLPVDAIE